MMDGGAQTIRLWSDAKVMRMRVGRTASASPSRGDDALRKYGTAGADGLNERTRALFDKLWRANWSLMMIVEASIGTVDQTCRMVPAVLWISMHVMASATTPHSLLGPFSLYPQYKQLSRAQQSKTKLRLRARLRGHNRRRLATAWRLRGTMKFDMPRHQPQHWAPQSKPATAMEAVGGEAGWLTKKMTPIRSTYWSHLEFTM